MATTPPGNPGGTPLGASASGINSPGNTTANQGFNQGQAEQLRLMVEQLGKLAPLMDSIVSDMDKFANKIKEADKSSKGLAEKFKTHGVELKVDLSLIDDVAEATKKIYELQRQMARETIKGKNYKEIIDALKEQRDLTEDLIKNGQIANRQAGDYKKLVKDTETAIADLTRKMEQGEPFDVSEAQKSFEKIHHTLRDIGSAVSKTGGSFSRFNKDVKAASDAWSRLTGMKERVGKYMEKGAEGDRISAQYEAKRAGRAQEFTRKKNRAEIGAADSNDPNYKRAAIQAAREAGFGRIGSQVVGRALANTRMDEKGLPQTGFMNKLAMRAIGSEGGGAGLTGALGMIEGGAGGLMSLAGRAAPVLAFLEVAKELFDKNQLKNKEVFDKLGGAGIISGAQTSGDVVSSLANVRANLNYAPNTLGIGYDKNLAIAQAMSEAGFSQRALATPMGAFGQPGIGRDQNGFMQNSFGSLQRNVYAYGKAAGLDPTKTMAETIKLIGQYRQSLESTESFFVKIDRDASRANITTSRYIQLIDEVNSHYDRSNKLLETTVDTMRLLSQTGTNTAESIKEGMDAITGGGAKLSQTQEVFANAALFSSPGRREAERRKLEMAQEDAIKNATAAGAGNFNGPITDTDINERIRQAEQTYGTGGTNPDANKLQSIRTSLEDLRKQTSQRSAFEEAAKLGNPVAAGLAYQSARSVHGEDIISQTGQQFNILSEAMRRIGGVNLGILGDQEARNKLFKSAAFTGTYGQALGGKPEYLDKIVSMGYDAARARMELANQGVAPGEENTAAGKYKKADIEATMKVARQVGFTGKTQGEYQLWASMDDNQKKMLEVLTKDSKTYEDIYDGGLITQKLNDEQVKLLKDQAISKARGVYEATTTTGEVFASAFEYLFNRIATPIQTIVGMLQNYGLHDKNAADASTLKDLSGYMDNGATKAIEKYTNDLVTLQESLKDDKKTPTEKAQIQADLDATKSRLQLLRSEQDMKGTAAFNEQSQTTAELAKKAVWDANNPHPGLMPNFPTTTPKVNTATAPTAPTVSNMLDQSKQFADKKNLMNNVEKVIVNQGTTTINQGLAVTKPSTIKTANNSGEKATPAEGSDINWGDV